MAKSTVELMGIMRNKGKDAGADYCKSWQAEINESGKKLSALLNSQKIDVKTYNQYRADLNKQMQELNSCIAIINRK